MKILVGRGTCGIAAGANILFDRLEEALRENNIDAELKSAGCFGGCFLEPVIDIFSDSGEKYTYIKVDASALEEIINTHIIGGKPCEKHLISPEDAGKIDRQTKIALRNCGKINPEDIDEYISSGGYEAAKKLSTTLTPDDVVETIKTSGLRGRGGAGFPTWFKWNATKNAQGEKKYVVCNADEGDPGAFMDRGILEGDPHAVLEGMLIAGFAVGASEGIVYVRAEYPLAIKRLSMAIDAARERGFLGKNVLGVGFDFDIRIKAGAGAFVCGEETALIASLEGKRGQPRPRPPFPAVKGFAGMPTVLNNVETYANVPRIILKGADWFTGIGTEKSKGTKVFALGGKVNNVGLVEVPMGTTLRQVVEEIGGGIPDGKKFKAAQTGGPSGGCIPEKHLDTPIDYDNLVAIGSMMGSGGMIVMDEDNCMVNIAQFFLDFTVDESCGLCPPCRIGTKRLYEMLEKICKGNADESILAELEDLCHYIKENSLCGLGQTAPNPVLSTLEHFRDEYIAHVVDKKCPAGVCKDLLRYEIIEEKCIGCTACKKVCPPDAISGELKKPHVIDQSKCIKCGACVEKCKFSAIVVR